MKTTLRRATWSVVGGAIILGGMWGSGGFKSSGIKSGIVISPNKQPDLRVEKEQKPRIDIFGMPTGGFDEYVKFTNVGRSRITIQNVLINDKEHCAKLGPFEPPVTLIDMGGWSSLRFACSGRIAVVRVETDRGNATYSWRQSKTGVEISRNTGELDSDLRDAAK